jgi:hypothetical protein
MGAGPIIMELMAPSKRVSFVFCLIQRSLFFVPSSSAWILLPVVMSMMKKEDLAPVVMVDSFLVH